MKKKKKENLSKETKVIKKEAKRNYRTKNYCNKTLKVARLAQYNHRHNKENHWIWGQKNRINPIWKTEERKDWKKTNRVLRTCGQITKDPTFTSLKSQKGKIKRGKGHRKKIVSENFLNLAKNTNLPTYWRADGGERGEWKSLKLNI